MAYMSSLLAGDFAFSWSISAWVLVDNCAPKLQWLCEYFLSMYLVVLHAKV